MDFSNLWNHYYKPVFLKAGEIAHLGAILMGKAAKNQRGIGGLKNTKKAKMLNH